MDHLVAKRVFDVLIATAALTLFLPILLVIALLIALSNGRPILFTQTRPGRGGEPFRIYKFRTMKNAEECQPSADSARLTVLGRFLRSTSLDELPELWNVLSGDMSLVGPRPLLMEYLPRYTETQARRHEVRPGITGWAQVNGRNLLSWEERFKHDVWYVDNRSWRLDLRILWMTVKKVVGREGISERGEATMSKFMGSES